MPSLSLLEGTMHVHMVYIYNTWAKLSYLQKKINLKKLNSKKTTKTTTTQLTCLLFSHGIALNEDQLRRLINI